MNEQSEHLSSAQIENYGNRTSGAGSDANQPDEALRINAHLESCPSCRSHLLDFHRTSFGLLANPQQLADAQVNTASTPECPSDDALRQFAAGLTPDALAAKLTQHAATCDHCGPLLRAFTEDFSDDFTPEEQAALDQLSSSSPKWQQRTAREMLKRATPAPPSPRPTFSWKWIMAPALPAVALIAVGIWYTQRDTPEKVAKLLAQASTERRNLEMRFPGAAHSDYKQTRSGDSESLLNSPASLRQAATLINAQLTKNPGDPDWLLMSARLNLLDWRYKPALAILDKIEDPKVTDSADMRMTRALALYEQAESEPERKDRSYGEIINLIGKTLQKTPDDVVALFDQATACEKLRMHECALGDYENLLRVEKDTGWATEARRRMDQIREKKTP